MYVHLVCPLNNATLTYLLTWNRMLSLDISTPMNNGIEDNDDNSSSLTASTAHL